MIFSFAPRVFSFVCVCICIYTYDHTFLHREFLDLEARLWKRSIRYFNLLVIYVIPLIFFPSIELSSLDLFPMDIWNKSGEVEMSERFWLLGRDKTGWLGILWPAECKRHALKISRTTGAPVATLGGLTRPRNSGSHTFRACAR